MATINKTPSSTWKAVIRKRGWPSTIKTFRTKRDAEDWARRTEDEMVRGVYIDRADANRMLLKSAIDLYLRDISSTKKPSTKSAEKHKAKALKAGLGDYSLAALNQNLIADYRDRRLADGKSPDTVRLELALLSHLFTIAIKEWHLGLVYNPVLNIRKPAPSSGRNRRLSAGEESALLKACDKFSNPMLGWIVRTGLYTGMRAGEITTLRRGQVDLKRRVVRLSNTKNGTDRTVPLSKEALLVLTEALNHPVRPVDTDLIFWGEPGRDKKRRPYEFRMAWKKIIKDTKISNLRFHDLRHEAVSRLVEIGLGDQEIAAISGHKSMQMLKRYTHLRAEDLVERLDQLQR